MMRDILFTILGIIIGTGATLLSLHPNPDVAALKARAYEHCSMVKASFNVDVDDLASNSPDRQEAAALRLVHGVVYHSLADLRLCGAGAVDLSRRDTCWVKHDYACLAEVARVAATSVKVP